MDTEVEPEVLATFVRDQTSELRVTLESFKGRPFVRLQIHEDRKAGRAPVAIRSCSVRLHEIEELIAVLEPLAKFARTGGKRGYERMQNERANPGGEPWKPPAVTDPEAVAPWEGPMAWPSRPPADLE